MILVDYNTQILTFLENSTFRDPVIEVKLEEILTSTFLSEQLLIVHEEIIKSCKDLAYLSKIPAIVIFGVNEDIEVDYKLENVVSYFSLNKTYPLLTNFLNKLSSFCSQQSFLKTQIFALNRQVLETMDSVEREMFKVKKMYEQSIPKRFESIKGASFQSKYVAGSASGGEFFDLFQSKNKVFVLMSATSSYLISSSVLTIFSDIKKTGDLNTQTCLKIIDMLLGEVQKINNVKSKPVNIDLMMAIIDLHNHHVEGYCFNEFNILRGSTHILNNDLELSVENIKKAHFSFDLERGERILFLSPGFNKNWNMHAPQFSIQELINNKEIKSIDILDEMYFQLKKRDKDDFLPHDASAILMEVDSNAILKV